MEYSNGGDDVSGEQQNGEPEEQQTEPKTISESHLSAAAVGHISEVSQKDAETDAVKSNVETTHEEADMVLVLSTVEGM